MNKPILILTTLVSVSASAMAFFSPSTSGDATNQKVDGLAKGGLMSQGNADAIKRVKAAADAHSAEVDSRMSDTAKQTASDHPGAQSAPTGAANGQPPAVPPAPPQLPPPPAWRLEGTTVGGHGAPSAIFAIAGWGQVVVHPGEKLNRLVRVVSIKGKQVTLRTKGSKHLERVSPW